MNEDEAVDQMELLGHDFFVFLQRLRAGINVLYRRTDGNYSLLEPELVRFPGHGLLRMSRLFGTILW